MSFDIKMLTVKIMVDIIVDNLKGEIWK